MVGFSMCVHGFAPLSPLAAGACGVVTDIHGRLVVHKQANVMYTSTGYSKGHKASVDPFKQLAAACM